MSDRNPYDLRAKYTRFRILVIGRANSGKTTLLQRWSLLACIGCNVSSLASVGLRWSALAFVGLRWLA